MDSLREARNALPALLAQARAGAKMLAALEGAQRFMTAWNAGGVERAAVDDAIAAARAAGIKP